jgi:4-amino-4-deoxy-L-arabinose transferase-like glycosyltransferase
VVLAILLYLAFHFAVRVAMPRALSVDDAEQALFSQFYAWAYRYKAPPLFVWMLATLGQVVPVNAVSIGLLRYVLLGATFIFVYLAARRIIADPRLSALSAYSFAAINTFAEASHRNLTHTTALAATIALSWYVFLRLAATPRVGWYLLLGAVFGLGMLAKWNFVILALALPVACLLHRDGRRLVLTWKIVPTALVAAVIVLPTGLATLRIGSGGGESVSAVLETGARADLWRMLSGTLDLLDKAWIYSLPLLPIVAVLFGRPLWRGLSSGGGRDSALPGAHAVGMTMAVGLGFLWALVVFLGATDFEVRYLYPVLLPLPVWLFMTIERGGPPRLSVNLFVLVMVFLALVVGGKRIVTQFTRLADCGLCMEMRPYPELASQIEDVGYRGAGTILASASMAGNLRVPFPRARIVDPTYPNSGWPPPAGEGQCLFVWEGAGETAEAPSGFTTYLADALGGRPGAPHAEGVASAPNRHPAVGTLTLGYRLYNGPNGDCR